MSKQVGSRGLRYRALRAALGGLLTSPLSDAELRQLAYELDLEFLEELRELLLSLQLRDAPYREAVSLRDAPPEDVLADFIYERAKARRVSKGRLIAYMREIDPLAVKRVDRTPMSLRELIIEFTSRSTVENGNRLLARVTGQPEQDPYLLGITARK